MLKAGPADVLEIIARAGEGDGWSLSVIQKSQNRVSFHRDSSGVSAVLMGGVPRASIDCTLTGRELQITYRVTGKSGAGERKQAEEELAAFKRRIEKALGLEDGACGTP